MDNKESTSKSNDDNGSLRGMAKGDTKETYGHVYLEDYIEACKIAYERAEEIGANTVVNLVPLQNGLLVKGTSLINKSSVLKPNPKDIMEDAQGFEFEVVAFGPDVKNIEIGDIVDIKSTIGLSLRPFVPHPKNVTVWRKHLKADRESMIRHNMASAEDPGKVGSVAAAATKLDIVDAKGGAVEKSDLVVDLEETITIVEHFATEDHNISAYYKAIDYVREG